MNCKINANKMEIMLSLSRQKIIHNTSLYNHIEKEKNTKQKEKTKEVIMKLFKMYTYIKVKKIYFHNVKKGVLIYQKL